MEIREKKIEDIPEFTLLVNKVWDETYRGIVDDTFLDNMKNTIDERIKRQIKRFNEKETYYSYVLVDNGKIIGYTSVDKSEEEEYPNSGEIASLYLLKEYQKKGYGKMLFNFSLKKLIELGYKDYIIGCLDKNPSNEFYKHMGGKLYNQKYRRIGSKEYIENFYIFNI